MRRELGVRDVVLFNIAAVVSIRWISTAAHIGPGALTLWVLAAVLFFVPLALSVARLHELYPREGGIYVWTGIAFGEWHGFLCGWCYWLSNLFYFPNLLLAGVGMSFYTFGGRWAAMADDRVVMTAVSLIVLWAATVSNLFGLRTGKWTQNLGAAATVVAGAVVIVAGLGVLARGGSATQFTPIAPEWNWQSLNYWSQIAFAFGGLELGAILSGEIRDPERTVRRAAWISAAGIAGFYVLGTLAMLALIEPSQVNVVTGLAQAVALAGARPVGLLIALGIMGQFGAWIGGSARLAFAIGADRYLPPAFSRLHPRWQTPHVALLSQAAATTGFVLFLQSGETLRSAYQLLVDMTVISYFIPFLYLFATAWKHGQRVAAMCGGFVTLAGLGCSFVPSEEARPVWLFELKLVVSVVVLVGSAWWIYRRKRLGTGSPMFRTF